MELIHSSGCLWCQGPHVSWPPHHTWTLPSCPLQKALPSAQGHEGVPRIVALHPAPGEEEEGEEEEKEKVKVIIHAG